MLHLQMPLPYLASVRGCEPLSYNDGVMEYWSIGVVERRNKIAQLKIFGNTPALPYSNTPQTIAYRTSAVFCAAVFAERT